MKTPEPKPGDTFHRLTFIAMAGTITRNGRTAYMARFLCTCGTTCTKELVRVRAGRTKSCDCLKSETGRINGVNGRPPLEDEVYTPSHPRARLIRARHNRDLVATSYPSGNIGSSMGMM